MKLKTNTKKIFLYGVGLFFMKAVSLLMLPIVTRVLSPEEYGTLEILVTLTTLLCLLLGFGLSDAIFRFGGMSKIARFTEVICKNAATQALLIGLIICIPIMLLADRIAPIFPGNVTSLQIIYLCLALIPSNVLTVQVDWLRLEDRVITFIIINLVRALIQAAIVLITLYAGYGVTGMMFATFLSTLLIFIYFLFVELKGSFDFNWTLQKKLFLYGLPLSFSGIADFTILWLDHWWLAFTAGTAEMAKFALAMKFSMTSVILIQPFVLWWFPQRFKYLDNAIEKAYCAKTVEVGLVLGFILALGISIASSALILLFIPASYHKAISYIPCLCFMFALKNAGEMMNIGLFLDKTSYQMWIHTFSAILAVIGFYFLIPIWEVWGVILVLNLVFTFRWFTLTYFSQREVYLPYHYLKLFLFVIAIGIGMGFVQSMSSIFDYLIKGGALWILIFVSCLSLKLLPPILIKKQ